MRRLHVAGSINTRSTRRRADLVRQLAAQPLNVGTLEEPIDAPVGGDVLDRLVDHGLDRVIAAKPLIKRRMGGGAGGRGRIRKSRNGGRQEYTSRRYAKSHDARSHWVRPPGWSLAHTPRWRGPGGRGPSAARYGCYLGTDADTNDDRG